MLHPMVDHCEDTRLNSKWIRRSLGVALVGGVLAAPAAMAQGYGRGGYYRDGYGDSSSGLYIGGSIGELIYNEPGLDTLYPSMFMFRIGVPLNPYLAVEGRLGAGLSNTRTYVDGDPVNVGVDSMVAGYLKGSLPLSPIFSLYGLAGAAHTRLSVDAYGQNGSTTDNSFSFGIGGDFNLNRDIGLNVEWVRTMREDGFDADGYTGDVLSVGLNWRL